MFSEGSRRVIQVEIPFSARGGSEMEIIFRARIVGWPRTAGEVAGDENKRGFPAVAD